MNNETDNTLNTFIAGWAESPEKNKAMFLHFKGYLADKEGVSFDFIPRPGVTYSLRARHASQKKKQLFVMIDVIEDDPRWLSICFYGEMITDPEGRGDVVPGGLLGEDAVCFDLAEHDTTVIKYLESRLDEACKNGANEQG
jgi:hypothetical protein